MQNQRFLRLLQDFQNGIYWEFWAVVNAQFVFKILKQPYDLRIFLKRNLSLKPLKKYSIDSSKNTQESKIPTRVFTRWKIAGGENGEKGSETLDYGEKKAGAFLAVRGREWKCRVSYRLVWLSLADFPVHLSTPFSEVLVRYETSNRVSSNSQKRVCN